MTSLQATLRAALSRVLDFDPYHDVVDEAEAAVVAWLAEDAQVEAAAQALHAERWPKVPWESLTDNPWRARCLHDARAALGALTTPTNV